VSTDPALSDTVESEKGGRGADVEMIHVLKVEKYVPY